MPVALSAAQARANGLRDEALVLPFAGPIDGTELVEATMAEAGRRGAVGVGEIAIHIVSVSADGVVECRTSFSPDWETESRWVPGERRLVPVSQPVSRMATERTYRCRTEYRTESRHVTEHERRCRTERRPVRKSRTVYRSEYDYRSRSSRRVPHTEYYTDYESRLDCRNEPVRRLRTERVPRRHCGYESETRLVTRWEFQLRAQYAPPRLEEFPVLRLRESAPVCYAAPAPADPARPHRVEAMLYRR